MRPRESLFAKKRVIALLAVVASLTSMSFSTLAITTSSASNAPHSTPSASSLTWKACDKKFQCSSLVVPLSYTDASKGNITLALIRIKSTGKHVVGNLVVNPGGPGGSGLQFLESEGKSAFPKALTSSFNIVSFDPRGIGKSDPINCGSRSDLLAYINANPPQANLSGLSQFENANKQYISQCEKHTSKLLLNSVGTEFVVKDLDRIRAALGDRQLTFMGFSYGTYMGELYAQEFPHQLRALVLDGVVNPALSNNASLIEQDKGFNLDLANYAKWCTTNTACHSALPDGVEKSVTAILNGLAAGKQIRVGLVPALGGQQTLGYGAAVFGVAAALYSQQAWPDLTTALHDTLAGDGSFLKAIALSYFDLQPDGSFDNLTAANTAISCDDGAEPLSVAKIKTLAKQATAVSPVFGLASAWGDLLCTYFPGAKSTAPTGAITAPNAGQILVVGSTGDPATPYADAVAVSKALKHATLLTRAGNGHTAYFSSTCIQSHVDQYLISLKTPPPGTICTSN